MEALIEKLKGEIIDQLNLEDVSLEDIGADDILFGEEIGLDSIDALELIVMLEKNYGIKIEDSKVGREVFQTPRTIAEYIIEQKPEFATSKL